MLELNKIYCCDCVEGMKQLEDNSVDLTVTSPPYDQLRTYQDDNFAWNFDIFKGVADELYRVTKPGGVVVWVVGDAVENGTETGTSFRQALYFKEIGFKLHDTMIYEKNSSTFPAKITSKRYSQVFEYMFVFVKGKKIRDDIKLIADKRNKWAGWINWGERSQYKQDGTQMKSGDIKPTPEFSLRNNIWKYAVSFNDRTGHPAVFPEKLAEDHILSWTKEGDLVLDPFMGSGTTAKMAMLNKRNYIGFEKNQEYWEVSLKRVAKYEGKTKDEAETIEHDFEDGTESFIVNAETDKETDEKTVIWNSLVEQMNEYFRDTSVSILKTLKLSFATKANDRRVENAVKKLEGDVEDKQPVENETKSILEQAISAWTGNDFDTPAPEPGAKQAYVAPAVLNVTPVPGSDVISDLCMPVSDCPKETDLGLDLPIIFATKEFSDAVNREIRRILSDDKLLSEILHGKRVEGDCGVTVNLPKMHEEFTVIDMETMDPVPLSEVPETPVKKGRGRPKGRKDSHPRKPRVVKQDNNEQ